MDEEKTVTIPMRAAICAARHFVYLHKGVCQSANLDKSLECGWAWELACAECSELRDCCLDWIEAAAPLFDATNIHPQFGFGPKDPNPLAHLST